MTKTVNVVLNSNNKFSGSATTDLTYFIDFASILKPNVPYQLHWTYVGMPNSFGAATPLAVVNVDFMMEQYLNRSSTNGSPTTYTIGVLRSFYLSSTINYLFADDNNNHPIYLPNRPLSNYINVRIVSNTATPVPWADSASAAPNAYILTLSFTEIEHETKALPLRAM